MKVIPQYKVIDPYITIYDDYTRYKKNNSK